MDRREFCKLAALAAGAIGFGGIGSMASPLAHRQRRHGRVTVVRRGCHPDLQSLFLDDPECGPCRAFTTGETFDLRDGCPPGFCPRAWRAIEGCLADASHCDGSLGDDGVIMASCPDGTRPVIFKIEL